MAVFEYRALRADGRRQNGLLSADHFLDLNQQLRAADLTLLRARELTALRRALRLAPNVSARELAEFFSTLQQIARTQTPLLRGLRAIVASTTNRSLREVTADIVNQLARGRSLSMALGTHAKVFGPVLVALVAAGERAGRLDIALEQCRIHVEWMDTTARRLTQALAYPLFLMGLSAAILVFMLTWLAPRVLEFLATLREAPGAATTSLLAFSAFVRTHWDTTLLLMLAGGALLVLARLTFKPLALWMDAQWLRLPLLGSLITRSDTQRFGHFMAVGMASGLSAQNALVVATGVVKNKVISRHLRQALERIRQGQDLPSAIGGVGMLTPLMVESLRNGALTDTLDTAFSRMATQAALDVQTLTVRITGLLPPAMTLAVGAVLIWILAALFLPIYSALSLEMLYR
jgi:type II secretory pathway component PulF